ncbi:serendipity locus protein alpha isoform X2 [Tribolium castaneum]|uniref:Serendipity locus protein alpha-like Protein n=1 Tax=Tribolium castaneum TaxID=7070 RepID=D2A524_TRICA|nr:PREDICTED: serendipity locus protein alpha isoform X2 [Tribolium castaneum]EFA05144.2 Serendipity locus protein alpha-like Protein [Tribolium castaneum]|eukprot:XP_008194575.1 PREDICTED: serendipity locus protein alpha isoform X2 [Tribolium castaneum]
MLPVNLTKTELNTSFACCEKHLHTLTGVGFNRNEILSWFQGLCQHLTTIIKLIGRYYKEAKIKTINSSQLLYLTQTLTTLSLLINIFVREDEIQQVVTEARKCVIKQMTCCLESIQVGLACPKDAPSDGNFVKWMDSALEKITEINVCGVYDEARHLCEEVLAHAMSIAQVSLPEDSKKIRGGCQAVLSALNSLESEKNNTTINTAMVNLCANACSDKLCILERKVNTAVLRLCLKTFSEFTTPLEKIHDFCVNFNNRDKSEELDGLVADFDLHVDRIMQIGLFAVSCSSDFARGIKIRSCLASLEALESELVPALTSLLLDNSVHNINCASILMKHWLNQAISLQRLIYLIIDPFAFCQVIYDEASEIVDNLSDLIRKKTLIRQTDVCCFLSIVKVLQTFLETAKSEFSQSELNKIQTKIVDFNEVLQETESASKVLLTDTNIDFDNCKRVLKRCRILLTVLKRLWFCFSDEDVLSKSVKNNFNTNEQMEPTGNPFLDHIINRGKQILQDRSVLYRTPVKNNVWKKNISNGTKQGQRREIPLSKLVHLRKFSFVSNVEKTEASLDLQITEILNEVTNLSTSLHPTLR